VEQHPRGPPDLLLVTGAALESFSCAFTRKAYELTTHFRRQPNGKGIKDKWASTEGNNLPSLSPAAAMGAAAGRGRGAGGGGGRQGQRPGR